MTETLEQALEAKLALSLKDWPRDVEPDSRPAKVEITLAEAMRIRQMIRDARKYRRAVEWQSRVMLELASKPEALAAHRGGEVGGSASYEFVKLVGRLTHTGDEDWTGPEPEDALWALDNLIAAAREIMAATPASPPPPEVSEEVVEKIARMIDPVSFHFHDEDAEGTGPGERYDRMETALGVARQIAALTSGKP